MAFVEHWKIQQKFLRKFKNGVERSGTASDWQLIRLGYRSGGCQPFPFVFIAFAIVQRSSFEVWYR